MGLGEREPNPDAWRSIERAANGHGTAIEHVPFDSAQDRGVDPGRPHVLMTEEFLHGAEVVATFKQMGGKTVAEGMTSHTLVDPG